MSARIKGINRRRQAILDAARRLMREPEGPAFSMRNLAEAAGVSIATPYNLFGSKQAILLAVLDEDLADFETRLAALNADAIEVLFEANAITSSLLRREPEFYRNALCAIIRDGPRFRFMVNGPRYVVWKRLLSQATQAGLLRDDIDPDAFAIASSQLMAANVMEWSQGGLTLDEMEARSEYGLALTLLAVATDRSRPVLTERMCSAEHKLQRQWQAMLRQRLHRGDLDDYTRQVLADQLQHLESKKTTEGAQ